jgi:hypothetical protein
MFTVGTPKDGVRLVEKHQGETMTRGITSEPEALLGDHQDGRLRQWSGYILFDVKVNLDPK